MLKTCLIAIMILVACATGHTQPASSPGSIPVRTVTWASCPTILVETSPDVIPVGTPIDFKAKVEGLEPEGKLTYTWEVSKGKITSGQGTASITVDMGAESTEGVTATVEVGGLDKGCQNKASVTTSIAKHKKHGEKVPRA